MAICPNKNSQEWKDLAAEVGTEGALSIFNANNYEIPTGEKLKAYLREFKKQENVRSRLSQAPAVEEIIEKINNPQVKYDPESKFYINTVTGEIVSTRTSDKVREFTEDKGWKVNSQPDNFFGQKGTVVHSWLQEIGMATAKGESFSHNSIFGKVLNLKKLSDFSKRDNSFFHVNNGQFQTLKMGMRDLISNIREIQKAIDPKGNVEFFFEVPLYDENKDMAGTADMLAVFSDGTAALYDFKTFSTQRQGERPGGGRIAKWEIQMTIYRNMLKDNYGVSDFRESRVIPISTSYSYFDKSTQSFKNKVEEGFQKLLMQSKATKDALAYLDPIPIAELPSDEALKELVEKLNTRKRTLESLYQNTVGKERSRVLAQLNSVSKGIRDLLLKKDIRGTIQDVSTLLSFYRKRMAYGKEHDEYMTYSDLYNAEKELQVYEGMASNFKNQLAKLPDAERESIRTHLNEVQTQIGNLIKDLRLEIVARFDKGRDGSILDPGDAMTAMGQYSKGVQSFNIPVFQELAKIYRYTDEAVRRQTLKEYEKILKYDEAFSKWAKENGYSQTNKFNLLFNPKTGNLYSEYTQAFWDKKKEIQEKARRNEQLTEEDRKFIDDNFTFNKEGFIQHFNERKRAYYMDIQRGAITEAEAKKKLTHFEKKYGNKYNGYYLTADSSNLEYKTKEWQRIQQDAPLKEYYDMYVNYNIEFGKILGRGVLNRNFVANVQKDLVDSIIEGGPLNAKEIYENIKQNYQIRQNDSMYGVVDGEGNPIPAIPVYFLDPLGKLSNSKIAAIEAEAETHFRRGTPEYEQEVERLKKKASRELGISIKSRDLTKNLMYFVNSVIQYEQFSNIEGKVKALQTIVHNDEMIKSFTVDERNRARVNKYTNELMKRAGLTQEYREHFDKFVNRLIYKKQFDKEIFNIENVSSNKVARSLMNYFSVTMIGFNGILVAANYIQAKSSFWMMAREGIHFDKKSFGEMVSSFSKRDPKYKGLVDYFEPSSRDLLKEKALLSGASVLGRVFNQRTYFLGHIFGDDNVDNATLVAMSKKYIVDDDGIIKTPGAIGGRKIINPDAPTVYDALQFDENGKPYIPGLTEENFADFRAKVQKIGQRIKGTMTEEQKGNWSSSMQHVMLNQFRTWMHGLAEQRFGQTRYDPTLETFDMGTFNAAFGEIIGNGFSQNLTQTLDLLAEVISLGLYKKKVNQAAVDRAYNKFIASNPQYMGKVNKEQFQELIRAKLNSFVAEARVYLTFFVMVQLAGGLNWDDEEEGNIFSYNAHQIFRRALLEVSFWWSPNSVDEIIKSPLPLWGMLQSVKRVVDSAIVSGVRTARGVRKEDEKGPIYHTLRITPGINQVLNILGYFDTYSPGRSVIEKSFAD